MPSNPRSPSRQEHVTATGWRVVGKAVSLVADESRAWELSAGRDDDVLFAAKFRLRPLMGRGGEVRHALTTLSNAIVRDWEDAPPLTRDGSLVRPLSRFHGVRWDVVATSSRPPSSPRHSSASRTS